MFVLWETIKVRLGFFGMLYEAKVTTFVKFLFVSGNYLSDRLFTPVHIPPFIASFIISNGVFMILWIIGSIFTIDI